MSVITGYISQVKKQIENLPYITLLEFRKIAYSYHYQNKDKELIFKYDNAEHHPELENFPHHKYVGGKVLPSEEFSVGKALGIIIDEISKEIS